MLGVRPDIPSLRPAYPTDPGAASVRLPSHLPPGATIIRRVRVGPLSAIGALPLESALRLAAFRWRPDFASSESARHLWRGSTPPRPSRPELRCRRDPTRVRSPIRLIPIAPRFRPVRVGPSSATRFRLAHCVPISAHPRPFVPLALLALLGPRQAAVRALDGVGDPAVSRRAPGSRRVPTPAPLQAVPADRAHVPARPPDLATDDAIASQPRRTVSSDRHRPGSRPARFSSLHVRLRT